VTLQQQCSEKGIKANIGRNERAQKVQEKDRCFDELLYKRRFVIERMNAWMDSFKALLVRFETKVQHWMALHFLAFWALLIRKKTTVKY
jgi:transposase